MPSVNKSAIPSPGNAFLRAGAWQLKPLWPCSNRPWPRHAAQDAGQGVLATVEGDIHEIGKSLVGTMLTSSGFEVYDLGVDAATSDILAKAEEVGADIIGLSALLTTTMVKQKEVIDEATRRGMKVKVMVGGAPVTKEWVHKIEADGYSEDAIGAVTWPKS
jgi:methanogenic corrinoid protein MtbC1